MKRPSCATRIIAVVLSLVLFITDGAFAAKTVIHIQDVHGDAKAQADIAALIRVLVEAHKVDLVALEGAFQTFDFAPIRDFPQKEAVRVAADYLLEKNEISGPVHAAFTLRLRSGRALPTFVGVDDEYHYLANVAAYNRSIPRIVEMKARLAAAKKERPEQSKRLFLVGKLLDFSLTSAEWGSYLKVSKKPIPELGDLGSFEDFYREAQKRDCALADNLLKSMRETHSSVAILVTGGFHSHGIGRRLKEARVQRISFTPGITEAARRRVKEMFLAPPPEVSRLKTLLVVAMAAVHLGLSAYSALSFLGFDKKTAAEATARQTPSITKLRVAGVTGNMEFAPDGKSITAVSFDRETVLLALLISGLLMGSAVPLGNNGKDGIPAIAWWRAFAPSLKTYGELVAEARTLARQGKTEAAREKIFETKTFLETQQLRGPDDAPTTLAAAIWPKGRGAAYNQALKPIPHFIANEMGFTHFYTMVDLLDHGNMNQPAMAMDFLRQTPIPNSVSFVLDFVEKNPAVLNDSAWINSKNPDTQALAARYGAAKAEVQPNRYWPAKQLFKINNSADIYAFLNALFTRMKNEKKPSADTVAALAELVNGLDSPDADKNVWFDIESPLLASDNIHFMLMNWSASDDAAFRASLERLLDFITRRSQEKRRLVSVLKKVAAMTEGRPKITGRKGRLFVGDPNVTDAVTALKHFLENKAWVERMPKDETDDWRRIGRNWVRRFIALEEDAGEDSLFMPIFKFFIPVESQRKLSPGSPLAELPIDMDYRESILLRFSALNINPEVTPIRLLAMGAYRLNLGAGSERALREALAENGWALFGHRVLEPDSSWTLTPENAISQLDFPTRLKEEILGVLKERGIDIDGPISQLIAMTEGQFLGKFDRKHLRTVKTVLDRHGWSMANEKPAALKLTDSIEDLNFSILHASQIIMALHNEGIYTIEELITRSEDYLQGVRKLGAKKIKEIKDRLLLHNWRLPSSRQGFIAGVQTPGTLAVVVLSLVAIGWFWRSDPQYFRAGHEIVIDNVDRSRRAYLEALSSS